MGPRIRDPGSGAFLTLDPGWKKNPDLGSGIRGEHLQTLFFPRAYNQFFGLKILKFFDADPGSGIFLTRDPGWKNSDPEPV